MKKNELVTYLYIMNINHKHEAGIVESNENSVIVKSEP